VGAKLSIDGGAMDDILVKPDNHDCGEWVCVSGHRIRRTGRMRMDASGVLLNFKDSNCSLFVNVKK
jgi:hypothetical protein